MIKNAMLISADIPLFRKSNTIPMASNISPIGLQNGHDMGILSMINTSLIFLECRSVSF